MCFQPFFRHNPSTNFDLQLKGGCMNHKNYWKVCKPKQYCTSIARTMVNANRALVTGTSSNFFSVRIDGPWRKAHSYIKRITNRITNSYCSYLLFNNIKSTSNMVDVVAQCKITSQTTPNKTPFEKMTYSKFKRISVNYTMYINFLTI